MSAWPAGSSPAIEEALAGGARRRGIYRRLLAAALLCLALGLLLNRAFTAGHPATPGAEHGLTADSLLSLPLAAQAPVSNAIGAGNPLYRLSGTAGGVEGVNPAQHLRLRFTSAGVSVASGAARLRLGLNAIGDGSSLQTIDASAPRIEAGRVVYSHPGITEWYANGPLGLEQGFTVPRAPARAAPGALTLSLALGGNLRASVANGGQTLVLSRDGHPALRYDGLVASDARGRRLAGRLEIASGVLKIRVLAGHASYPIRIDPLVQDGAKLTGGEETGKGHFAAAVAISADGTTAIVGGADDNEGAGAVWVFSDSGGTWTQQGPKLTGGGASGVAEFGSSVALSGDGDIALIGGGADNEGFGAAWVFTRSGSTWSQQGSKLTGGEEVAHARFGDSVALSEEGNTALIGGGNDGPTVANGIGAAWVFTRSGSTWSQQGPKITVDCTSSCGGAKGTGEEGSASFGASVALSADGNTALIGGPYEEVESESDRGSAWVFTRSGSEWSQQGPKLTPTDFEDVGGFIYFGRSVSLSADGNTALIGGPFDGEDLEPTHVGAAWVFKRTGSTWAQDGSKLLPSPANDSEFGSSVALAGDGKTALIGGPNDASPKGAAWVFGDSTGTWAQEGSALVPDDISGPGAFFGGSLAISGTGETALIGGYQDNLGTGAAWIFTPSSATSGGGTSTGTVTGTGTSTSTSTGTGSPPGFAGSGTHKPVPSLAEQFGLPSTKACLSRRKFTIHIAEHVLQGATTLKIKSAEVLVAGRVLARVKGSHLIAHVSLVGFKKGAFKIAIKATTTRGKKLSASATYHTCAAHKRK